MRRACHQKPSRQKYLMMDPIMRTLHGSKKCRLVARSSTIDSTNMMIGTESHALEMIANAGQSYL
eukprot:scaffold27060_cov111-Skeletonema_dohrnii-CCMP3373.AAC.1